MSETSGPTDRLGVAAEAVRRRRRTSGWKKCRCRRCRPAGCCCEVLYLSLDPYMRGRMDDRKSYAKPVGIGEVMEGESVCEVDRLRPPAMRAGDIVLAPTGWRTHATWDGARLRKLDPAAAPITTGAGRARHAGLHRLCRAC